MSVLVVGDLAIAGAIPDASAGAAAQQGRALGLVLGALSATVGALLGVGCVGRAEDTSLDELLHLGIVLLGRYGLKDDLARLVGRLMHLHGLALGIAHARVGAIEELETLFLLARGLIVLTRLLLLVLFREEDGERILGVNVISSVFVTGGQVLLKRPNSILTLLQGHVDRAQHAVRNSKFGVDLQTTFQVLDTNSIRYRKGR